MVKPPISKAKATAKKMRQKTPRARASAQPKKLIKTTARAAAKKANARAATTKARMGAEPAAKKMAAPAKPRIKVEHIYGFVRQVAGPQGLQIVECLGDGATDEKIEEKTQLKIAEVRSILNHLHSYGVVEYSREKNMNNGWFTYTWKANPERAMQNYLGIKKREYDSLRRVVSEDGAQQYFCRKGCASVPFDEAMDLKFRCPKCSSNMAHRKNETDFSKIEREITDIERVLSRAANE